jgi:hypothetical protein
MERLSELRTLVLIEAYLTDLICDVREPGQADVLMQLLVSVQQALVQLEGPYTASVKSSLAS